MVENFLDLVIGGPDMSGTTTQIDDIINYFQEQGKIVRDLRGTEIDALFHAEVFFKYNKDYTNLQEFLNNTKVTRKKNLIFKLTELARKSKLSSMVRNDVSMYITPNSADVWISEEPPKRGAGQTNRFIEQNRSKWDSSIDPQAAAVSHSVYRIEEFFRFRQPLRKAGKILLRSRSEESAPYQIYDKEKLSNGISLSDYLNLPWHEFAFGYAPTHIFIACAPLEEDWTTEKYLELKNQREGDRKLDDHELNPSYQVLVNQRYASNWLETLYEKGCKMYRGKVPEIYRFNMLLPLGQIKEQMLGRLTNIIDKMEEA